MTPAYDQTLFYTCPRCAGTWTAYPTPTRIVPCPHCQWPAPDPKAPQTGVMDCYRPDHRCDDHATCRNRGACVWGFPDAA